MDEQIRKHFIELKVTGQRFAKTSEVREKDLQLIDYLKSVVDNNIVTEFEDLGFCYWNISDNYALIKDGYALMCNHQTFYEHIKSENCRYLYWLVCDASQRLTLEKTGYSEFWWALYQEATEQNLSYDNYFIEFAAHRAALYKNSILSHTPYNLEYAKSNFEKFIQKTKYTPEYQFYRVIYLSLISRFSSFDKTELKNLCENLFNGLLYPETTNDFLIGEWRNFITPFDIHKQSVVGINSAINAFIYSGELQIAKEIYTHACKIGLPKNHYIETRLM